MAGFILAPPGSIELGAVTGPSERPQRARQSLLQGLAVARRIAEVLLGGLSRIHRKREIAWLPHVKLGRRTLFLRRDLDAWVIANRVMPRP